jgi:DNA-binding NarL/FixJ family response regulator
MQAQRSLTRPAAEAAKSGMGAYFAVRVFLLSDCRLLREALGRALKNHGEIVLVGAQPFSTATPAHIIESACDVLLMDPVNISAFDARILDALKAIFFEFQIVIIDREAGISDVFSSVLTVTQSGDGFVHEANPTGP